jgi:GABA permease
MLFVLAARREAPRWMLDVSGRGVPVKAILASTLIGYLCVIAAFVSPKTVFLFLLNSSGAVILFVYLMICLSQLRMRRIIERTAPERLRIKMWFYPVLTILVAAAIVAVLVAMFVRADTRSQIVLSLLAWAVALVAYAVLRRIAGPAVAEAHMTEQGLAAEQKADAWMHEHGAAAELEVDAVVGEGRLPQDLIRRADEEAYTTQGA